ncbi:MAG TPA: hypothetical protein VGO88_04715, partial [Mycetocola sp.]|nr:hypothetical protein [Mycetocola sp.]
MARLRTVERKTGTAYEVHRRQGATKKQRTFTAKRTAERFAMKVETELAEGDSTEPLVKKAKTVAQVIEASMAASKPELKPRTFHSYELLYANRILPTFGSRRVST